MEATLKRALELLEYAVRLRMYGERAPGGNETWAQFDRDSHEFLSRLQAEGYIDSSSN